MKIVKPSKLIPLIPILTVIALAGCQPKKEQSAANAEKVDIPLIQAKVVAVKLPKQKLCLEDGCTSYDLQTVETNQKWIDEYFISRMKKAEPNAFANIADQKVKLPADEPSLSESSTTCVLWGKTIIWQLLPFRPIVTLRVRHMVCRIRNL